MKRYGPADPAQSPRYAGVSTFLRLTHRQQLDDVDVAVVGLPFENDEAGARTGTRFGPQSIREVSDLLRPDYHPVQRLAVFDHLSVIDYGDVEMVSGFADRSSEQVTATLLEIHRAGAAPLGLGGSREVLLAELRAAAAHHGPLGLVAFRAQSETAAGEATSSVLRQAIDEGLVDAPRSALFGIRGGSLAGDLDREQEEGLLVVTWDDLAQLGTGAVAAAVDRAAGPSFLSFDIGFVDPAFAPGTSAPVCGGPTSAQALALLRGCRGLNLVGADVLELTPELDSARLAGLFAATAAWEILALIAADRQATA